MTNNLEKKTVMTAITRKAVGVADVVQSIPARMYIRYVVWNQGIERCGLC